MLNAALSCHMYIGLMSHIIDSGGTQGAFQIRAIFAPSETVCSQDKLLYEQSLEFYNF
jgi:hypothetical protein